MSLQNANGDKRRPPSDVPVLPLAYAAPAEPQVPEPKPAGKEPAGRAALIGCLAGLLTGAAIAGLAYWLATLVVRQ